MPANLPSQYFEVEKRYRMAKTPEEKIALLEEMLAIMPKHKGTDHLQGDIKAKIAKLKKEEQKRTATGRRAQLYHVEKEGAAQVVLVGPPNVGKSQILASLTRASPEVAPYPFTTQRPFPGMIPFEDIQIQLVDLPPFTSDYEEPWLFGLVRNGDLALLVCDLGAEKGLSELERVIQGFESSRIRFGRDQFQEEEFGFVRKKAILVANKCDLEETEERLKKIEEFCRGRFPFTIVSALEKRGLEELRQLIFRTLEIVRVYTKVPGKPVEKKDPIILKKGDTVIEAARSIHKDFAQQLKYARMWGKSVFEGQRVERDHVLEDGDIVEFHI